VTEQAPSVRRSLRPYAVVVAVMAAIAIAGQTRPALAQDQSLVEVKVAGKLDVPAKAPLSVIATDPVLQQTLSQDLQIGGRLAGVDVASVTTVTVTLSHRVLTPGMSLDDVAPGDHNAVALLKAMGVRSLRPPAPPFPQMGRGTGQMAAQGNSSQRNDIQSYGQQGRQAEPEPGAAPFNPLPLMPWPVPPATAQQRLAPPYYMPPPNYHPGRESESETAAHATYDTVFIARATAGQGGSTLTVLAVAHPGYDPHQVRVLIAEEIANALLH
jgi:hypothetical protein